MRVYVHKECAEKHLIVKPRVVCGLSCIVMCIVPSSYIQLLSLTEVVRDLLVFVADALCFCSHVNNTKWSVRWF